MIGSYLSHYQYDGHTESIVSTQFESHYARECFPCIDEPAAKATFDLTITIPDLDDTVISNMPVENVVKNTTEKTTTFKTTPKMSTYLLAFCIGKFHSRSRTSLHGIKVTTYCALNHDLKNVDFANQIATDALDFYDNKFGVKYPLEKLDQIAIPDFDAGAMENWGLVTYRESCLLANKETSLDTKEYIALVIAHELSHQWFGNLVTMQWWNNLWLNESFANLMEYICVDSIHPEYHIFDDYFTSDAFRALSRDALPGVQAVQQDVDDPDEIATLFDPAIVYAKGSRLLFMLYRLIGQRQFFAGLKTYFKRHKYGNTTGDDLWAALQEYASFSVKDFMDAWISQPGYPVITDGTQQRFLLSGATDDTKWPLPAITDDMSGHYIVNLSGPEFAEKLQNFSKLSMEQKVRLLVDRELLSKTSLVSSALHLDLLPHFKDEENHSVWDLVSSIIADLKLFFPDDDPDAPEFKRYIYNIIRPGIERLGLKPKKRESSNDAKLRITLSALAVFTEDPVYLEQLTELYDKDYAKIPSELRSQVLIAKLFASKEKTFDELLKNYQITTDPEMRGQILYALSRAKHQKRELLGLLKRPDIVRPQDHMYLYIYLLRNQTTRKDAIKWLYQNWDYLEEMTGGKSIEEYPRFLGGALRTKEELADFEDFFDPKSDDPRLSRTLILAKNEINARLRLIMQDNTDVHRHLQGK